jgi:hypothetical protein
MWLVAAWHNFIGVAPKPAPISRMVWVHDDDDER